jgi:hypothetical protein
MLRYTIAIALTACLAVNAQPQVKHDLITLPKETGKYALNAIFDPDDRAKYCAKTNQVTALTATDFVVIGAGGGCGPAAGVPALNLPTNAKRSTIKTNRKTGNDIATKRRELVASNETELSLDSLLAQSGKERNAFLLVGWSWVERVWLLWW